MWKYVSRRIRDTFERSANHFDKRSTTGLTNSPNNFSEEKKKRSSAPCCWFTARKCWNSYQNESDTHSKRWNFEQLNRTWIGAITWSSALVIGWYTSQLIHLKLKHSSKDKKSGCTNSKILNYLYPYVNYVDKNAICTNSISKIEQLVGTFTPTVHSVSNDRDDRRKEDSVGSSTSNPDVSDNVLGDVLNTIENKLGLAAIENGQHKDGLSLLRSAANRNHAPALYNLGLCYEMGLGVTIDEKMAMELYRAAAALEHPGALYNLGIFYGQGRGGLVTDRETATRLLRLAALKGQQDAVNALKTLDDDSNTPVNKPSDDSWRYEFSPYKENDKILPFSENVHLLYEKNCHPTVY